MDLLETIVGDFGRLQPSCQNRHAGQSTDIQGFFVPALTARARPGDDYRNILAPIAILSRNLPHIRSGCERHDEGQTSVLSLEYPHPGTAIPLADDDTTVARIAMIFLEASIPEICGSGSSRARGEHGGTTPTPVVSGGSPPWSTVGTAVNLHVASPSGTDLIEIASMTLPAIATVSYWFRAPAMGYSTIPHTCARSQRHSFPGLWQKPQPCHPLAFLQAVPRLIEPSPLQLPPLNTQDDARVGSDYEFDHRQNHHGDPGCLDHHQGDWPPTDSEQVPERGLHAEGGDGGNQTPTGNIRRGTDRQCRKPAEAVDHDENNEPDQKQG